MKLEWHAKLNTDMVPAKNFRRTSIICTIGMSELLYLIPRIFALLRIVLASQDTDVGYLRRPQDQLRREDQRSPQRYERGMSRTSINCMN
jgi:hypothetical protein